MDIINADAQVIEEMLFLINEDNKRERRKQERQEQEARLSGRG